MYSYQVTLIGELTPLCSCNSIYQTNQSALESPRLELASTLSKLELAPKVQLKIIKRPKMHLQGLHQPSLPLPFVEHIK